MNKRKNNLKEMERRVQLNTSNSTAPAESARTEMKTMQSPKVVTPKAEEIEIK